VIVVADTSVLINLCRVRQGDLLKRLFHDVVIPPAVAAEFLRLTAAVPRFASLSLPAGIRLQAPSVVFPAVRAAAGLDAGESAALSLALEIHANAILLDERRGHEVAVALGLPTIGLLGILLRAKATGILPSVRSIIDTLQRDAGFWISDSLRKQVLHLAGEA
jgi:predicted nucleic acid-binding protein